MDRALLATGLLSLIGMAAMAAIALASDPPLVPLPDLGDHVGGPVRTEADVRDVRPAGPFVRYLLSDGNRSVEAVADRALGISPGDRVRVEGVPERFQGRLQLRLEPQGLQILRPWRENHVPLTLLLAEPWSRTGMNLVTSGLVETQGEPSRVATPDGGRQIHATDVPPDLPRGVLLLLEARLLYDPQTARFDLQIGAWQRVVPGGA